MLVVLVSRNEAYGLDLRQSEGDVPPSHGAHSRIRLSTVTALPPQCCYLRQSHCIQNFSIYFCGSLTCATNSCTYVCDSVACQLLTTSGQSRSVRKRYSVGSLGLLLASKNPWCLMLTTSPLLGACRCANSLVLAVPVNCTPLGLWIDTYYKPDWSGFWSDFGFTHSSHRQWCESIWWTTRASVSLNFYAYTLLAKNKQRRKCNGTLCLRYANDRPGW